LTVSYDSCYYWLVEWELKMNKSTTKRAKQEMHKSGEQAVKKPYVSPRLVEYGNVAKLTSSGGSGATDGLQTMMGGICL
jgi:hypothetical protein